MRSAALVAILLAVGALGGAGRLEAASAEEDLLLVESDRGGVSQLYLVSTDGRAIRRLGTAHGETSFRSVSPDGRRIVYWDAERDGVFMVGSDGRQERRIGGDFDGSGGSWNPTGFLYAHPQEASIAVFDRAGRRRQLVLDAEGASATWSPEGGSLAFLTAEERTRIDHVRADGTDRRSFVRGSSTDAFDPAWSPDGRRIVYARTGEDEGPAYLVSAAADGRELVRLTRGPESSWSPTWSPDGGRIAYVRAGSDDEEGTEIWTIRSDGTEARRVTSGFSDDKPAWSTDGRTILFDREYDDERFRLHRVAAGGGNAPPVRTTEIASEAAWLPAGDRFVATVRRGRRRALGLFARTGSLQRLLTRPGDDSAAAVSADGSTIAFVRNGRIAVLPSTGGSVRLLTTGDEFEHDPAWGPAGLTFAVGPSTGVSVVDLETSRRRTIARDANGLFGKVSWSVRGDLAYPLEDGVRIRTTAGTLVGTYRAPYAGVGGWSRTGAYLAADDLNRVVFLRRDGTVIRVLRASSWAWHPDGRRIVVTEAGRQPRVVDLATGRPGAAIGTEGGRRASDVIFGSGGRLAFDLERLPKLSTDVYLAESVGAPPRQVTRAFPDGGTNTVVGWARGPRPPGLETPLTRRLRLRTLVRARHLHDLRGAGARIIYVAGPPAPGVWPARAFFGYQACLPFHVLDARRDRTYHPCRGDSPLLAASASSRGIAWVLHHEDSGIGDEEGSCLYAVSAGSARSTGSLSRPCDPSAPGREPVLNNFGEPIGPVESAGDLMVAELSVYEDDAVQYELVRIDGRRLTVLTRTKALLELLAVDPTRIAARLGGGPLVVYRPDGAILRMLPFPKGSLLDVAFDGDRFVALRPDAIEQYDLATGIRLARVPIQRGLAAQPSLHGASGGRAVYIVGAVIHVVRFSDRTDRGYRIDGLVPPVHAALTRSTLYIGANIASASLSGLVGYVALRDLG